MAGASIYHKQKNKYLIIKKSCYVSEQKSMATEDRTSPGIVLLLCWSILKTIRL